MTDPYRSKKCSLFLTGTPGVGKTTLLQSVLQRIFSSPNPPLLFGFYINEVRASPTGPRLGYDARDVVTGRCEPLARLDDSAEARGADFGPRVGRYRVRARAFDAFAATCLATPPVSGTSTPTSQYSPTQRRSSLSPSTPSSLSSPPMAPLTPLATSIFPMHQLHTQPYHQSPYPLAPKLQFPPSPSHFAGVSVNSCVKGPPHLSANHGIIGSTAPCCPASYTNTVMPQSTPYPHTVALQYAAVTTPFHTDGFSPSSSVSPASAQGFASAQTPFSHNVARLYVADEVGAFESHSPLFARRLRQLLDNGHAGLSSPKDGPGVVFGTVALKSGGALAGEIRARKDVLIVEVTRANRDRLVDVVADHLRSMLSEAFVKSEE